MVSALLLPSVAKLPSKQIVSASFDKILSGGRWNFCTPPSYFLYENTITLYSSFEGTEIQSKQTTAKQTVDSKTQPYRSYQWTLLRYLHVIRPVAN